MTASSRRRRSRTVRAAATGGFLVVVAAALFVVGVVTLSNSEEGSAVDLDDRPRMALPDTSNAAFALVDRNGALASVVVMTLLPDGQGGSIVTVPVNADVTAGFGAQRRALSDVVEVADVESLRRPLEEILTITVERADIIGVEQVEDLLTPFESVQVRLPDDVVDSSAVGTGIVAQAGSQMLRRSLVAEALVAVNAEGDAADEQAIDVALWSAIAQSAPAVSPPPAVPTDDLGRPIAPETAADLAARLWEGEVAVRDLGVYEPTPAENPTGADVVVIDRADSVLVFAQVSPALVATPSQGLSVRLEVPFTTEQLAASGGDFETSSELARTMVARVLFFEANVVSVDTSPAPDGAGTLTEVEVSEERFLADSEAAAEVLYGPSDVKLADVVLDGVDVVVRLGTAFLDRESAGPSGEDPEGLDVEDLEPADDEDVVPDDSGADPAVTSGGADSSQGTTVGADG